MAASATRSDDAELVRRAKDGEPEAFSELYDRYHPAVYRYVYYRVADGAVAEDLASDVFVRLVERIGGFRCRGRPILAWLYTIARNLVVDQQRRAGRHPTVPLDQGTVVADEEPSWSEDQELTRQTLAACVERLTEDQRRVILLKFVEGLDNATTARVLGKPVGAVKSLQHRALAAMRRILSEEGDW